ncbi:siderophore-interacting protein [Shimia sp. MMG029]|uniref:siderophore-interacting protein n=1 Tax=Shimia sp. MMG029 TaxID=3021978 RepID=UPI0022FE700A|nr:siderophore-interacting protein [Shimia sp. MMG029]MDA5555538.1 siderophore-interacting protein [Shimia sp. MMG029]
MPRPQPRMLEVLRTEMVTPNMRRVVFGGQEITTIPEGYEGGYIKLIFPDAPHSTPDRVVMRTYSIRAFDADKGEMAVDFALHGDAGGLATDWAMTVQPGDRILIGGPGSVKMVDPAADWVMLAGDMTAIPALMCNFERLTADTKGYVVIEITSEADKQDLNLPEGIELHWVINPTPEKLEGKLVEQIKALPWLEGQVSVWTACEFDSMRALRSYYRTDRGVGRDQIYLSSYWRAGRTEDQHKVDKQVDSAKAA